MNFKNLPEECFIVLPATKEMVMVRRGETGYYPQREENAPWGAENLDALNERMGVSKGQAEAMAMGSMYGWDSDLSDPTNYDENGKWIK